MDNGDANKSFDDVSKSRDEENPLNPHENSEEEEDNDDVTINTEEDDDDVTDDEDEENGVQRIGVEDYDDEEEGSERHQKKRKMKTLLSSYEFAPRLPDPTNPSPSSGAKPSPGGRNPLTDWTEPETFRLLTAWGERFLRQGRKSLRSEQWQEVAEKVNKESKIVRTETQCRNRLDTLKKKYKKDKAKFGDRGNKSNWLYFEKMDSLLCAPKPKEKAGLLAKSGKAKGLRDGPEDDSEGLPPKRMKGISSFKLLADSINRFSEVYEKMEASGRRQMEELERIRVQFSRELEMEKKAIVERAKAEIERIVRGKNL